MLLRPYAELTDALNGKRRIPVSGNIRVGFIARHEMPAYSSNSSSCAKIPIFASSASAFVM